MKVKMQEKVGSTTAKSPRVFKPTREVFGISGRILPVNLQLECKELIDSEWIDSDTTVQDFLKLFQDHNCDVKILWTGKVGLGSLKALFLMKYEGKFITCHKSSLLRIIGSHFVVKDKKTGKFKLVGDLRGAKYTHKSDAVIKTCRNLLEIDINGKSRSFDD